MTISIMMNYIPQISVCYKVVKNTLKAGSSQKRHHIWHHTFYHPFQFQGHGEGSDPPLSFTPIVRLV